MYPRRRALNSGDIYEQAVVKTIMGFFYHEVTKNHEVLNIQHGIFRPCCIRPELMADADRSLVGGPIKSEITRFAGLSLFAETVGAIMVAGGKTTLRNRCAQMG